MALFSFPLVRGYGRVHRNPTSLPHNYTANLILVLAVVAAAVAAAAWLSASRRRDAG